jgi:hypothetical protein
MAEQSATPARSTVGAACAHAGVNRVHQMSGRHHYADNTVTIGAQSVLGRVGRFALQYWKLEAC